MDPTTPQIPAVTPAETPAPAARSAQQYIDETPRWADGTDSVATPLTRMQWLIWLLAAAGKFFEGMIVFMTGVALPLVGREFSLGPLEHGLVAGAALLGILLGASLLGGLADRFGRKWVFVAEMVLFAGFLAGVCVSPSFPWFLLCLLGVGFALGGDYPTAHMVISEAIPSRVRGRLVLSAFGFQAVGALVGTAIGYLILSNSTGLEAWRWMYGVAVVPAVLVVIGRLFVTESVPWLSARGRTAEAERAALRLLRRRPAYPTTIRLKAASAGEAPREGGYRALFARRHRRATILAAVPWFLQDLGTYGIGIFTPTILAAAVGHKRDHVASVADLVHNDLLAARGGAVIDLLLIVGIAVAILLTDRVGRIRLQVIGFIGCAVGLAIAAGATFASGGLQIVLIFAGFMLFNFMTNMGPNAQTYLIAGEVFPTAVRGRGAGFAASFAKIGAVLTAFLFPVLLASLGKTALLSALVLTSLVGAWVTWRYRIETRGVSLEDARGEPAPPPPPSQT